MTRTVSLFWYFLTWQRTMLVTTITGAVLIGIGIVTSNHMVSIVPTLLGLVLTLGFPTFFAGTAFRELVANKRMLMLPDLRALAVTALLLLALTDGVAVGLLAGQLSRDSTLPAVLTGVAAFGFVSIFLVLGQWLITLRLGVLYLMQLPFLLGFVLSRSDRSLWLAPITHWLVPALAACSWIWLFAAMRGPRPPHPAAAIWLSGAGVHRQREQQAPDTCSGSPAGSLLRGMSDRWWPQLRRMTWFVLSFVGSIAAVLWVVRLAIPVPVPEQRIPLAQVLLIFSFFAVLVQTFVSTPDFPGRLRLLWLRAGGDRHAAWKRIEKALLQDSGLIGIVASLVAATALLLTDVRPAYLLVFVAAAVTVSLLYGYLAFWIRARGWPHGMPQLVAAAILMVCSLSLALMAASGKDVLRPMIGFVAVALPLIPLLRPLARRQVSHIDWCRVRPVRRPSLQDRATQAASGRIEDSAHALD